MHQSFEGFSDDSHVELAERERELNRVRHWLEAMRETADNPLIGGSPRYDGNGHVISEDARLVKLILDDLKNKRYELAEIGTTRDELDALLHTGSIKLARVFLATIKEPVKYSPTRADDGFYTRGSDVKRLRDLCRERNLSLEQIGTSDEELDRLVDEGSKESARIIKELDKIKSPRRRKYWNAP